MNDLPSARELEVLNAVLRHGTAGAAARALDITQPAVSRSLAALEARLGRPLFDRRSNRLLPRPEAFALDEGAQALLGALGRLVRGVEAKERDPVALVTTATLAQAFLAPRLPALMTRWPTLALQVEITSGVAAQTAVADRRSDLGLVDQYAGHGSLDATVLHSGNAAVAMPAGHDLARAGQVTLAMLSTVPLIALPRRFPLRAALDRAFRAQGLSPRIALEAATSLFAARMVLSGVGVAVLNPFPLADHLPNLVFRPLLPALPIRTAIVTPASAPPSPAVARLVAWLVGGAP